MTAKHWKPEHVEQLREELDTRYYALRTALSIISRKPECVTIKNPTSLRLAINDCRALLAELKRLV